MCEISFGSADLRSLSTLDELATAVIATTSPLLIASSRRPVVRLQVEIARAVRPILVILGDPRAALKELVEDAGVDLAQATRLIAGSCATLVSVTKLPTALVVSGEQSGDHAGLAMQIARHFGFTLTEDDIAMVAVEHAEAVAHTAADAEIAWWNTLSTTDQAMVEGALRPYIDYFAGREIGTLVWHPGLFYTAGEGGGQEAAIKPVDITGRARCLVYGPYINLPPGDWAANIVLAFSAEAVGLGFTVEVAAGVRLAFTRVEPTHEQVINMTLLFTIEDSAIGAVEIRVFSERAAFDGRLALGYVELTQRGGVGKDVESRLAEMVRR
jgi:hypothetical protein